MQAIEEKISDRVKKAIDDRVFPGCVVGVVGPQEKQHVFSFGYHTYEKDVKTEEDTVYDVASITKAIPTHSLLLNLIDQEKASLEDRVVQYIPGFNTSAQKREVTLRHLLSYTLILDLGDISAVKEKQDGQEVLDAILSAPIDSLGKKFFYANATAVLSGMVVEEILGKRLDDSSQDVFFQPMEMRDTTFHPDQLAANRIVPTENEDKLGRTVHGEVHDESTYLLQEAGYYLGAAGLFSTAPDLLTFLEMFLRDGKLNDKRYFSQEMIDKMFSVHYSDEEDTAGLGWVLNAPRYMGDQANNSTFGKTGFTGCVVVGDRARDAGFVLLSNRVYPDRGAGSDNINSVRSDIADIVWSHANK